MTVSAHPRVTSYAGDGTTMAFVYPFKILSASEIEAVVRDASGADSVKALGVDYTVSGVGNETGGQVTFTAAPASGETVFLVGVTSLDSSLDLEQAGQFPSASMEGAADKLTRIAQELDTRLDRATQVRLGETGLTVPDLETRKGNLAGYDSVTEEMTAGPSLAGLTALEAAIGDILTLNSLLIDTAAGFKRAVDVYADADLTLSGVQAIDGFTGAAGLRVGVGGQADPTENGIYVMAAGAWARSEDANAAGDFVDGSLFLVLSGTVYQDDIFAADLTGTWTPGSTAMSFTEVAVDGAAGADGNTIHYGTGAPSDALGKDGDMYVDQSTNQFYYPKAGGSWPEPLTFQAGGQRRWAAVNSQVNQSINNTTHTHVNQTAVIHDTKWQPSDGGPEQRFWLGADFNFTADHTTEQLTKTAHGFVTGEGPIELTNSGGALPAGLAALTKYWVIRVTDDIFKLATSRANALAGTAVAFTDNGTGTHSTDTANYLVIPAGVTLVDLEAMARFNSAASGTRNINFKKHAGGADSVLDSRDPTAADGASSDVFGVPTILGSVRVSEGDRIVARVFQASGAPLTINSYTEVGYFSLTVAEPLQALNGKSILTGSGAPSDSLGADGDVYFDTTNLQWYGPKAGGTWPAALTLPVNAEKPGAMIRKASAQAIGTGAFTDIPFDTTVYDTKWDPGDGGLPIPFWLGGDIDINTVDTGLDEVTLAGAHNLETGYGPFYLVTTGTLPGGLLTNTKYWAIKVDATKSAFATSRANALAGTRVNLTSAGSGVNTLDKGKYIISPPGVTKMRIRFHAGWAATPVVHRIVLSITKRGGGAIDGVVVEHDHHTNGQNAADPFGVETHEFQTADNELYVCRAFHNLGSNRNIAGAATSTWVQVSVIEPGQVGAGGSSGTNATELSTYVNSGSPMADDLLGPLKAFGNNTTPAKIEYARRMPVLISPTPAAEYGQILERIMKNGTITDVLKLGALDSGDLTLFGLGLMADGFLYREIASGMRRGYVSYDREEIAISSDASITFTTVPSSGVMEAVWEFDTVTVDTDDVEMHFQFTNGGTPDASNVYDNTCQTANTDDNTNGHGTLAEAFGFIGQKGSNYSLGNDTGERFFGRIGIVNPNNAGGTKEYWFRGNYIAANTRHVSFSGGGIYQSNAAVDGIKIFPESGLLLAGTVRQRVVM